jgi:hypothetical protein
MDLIAINTRVDSALQQNRRAEYIVIGMAVAIFVLGLAVVLVGYRSTNLYITGGATLFQAFLYWPVREILKLRRDNLILQTLPALTASLPPKHAADEIIKLLESLRK